MKRISHLLVGAEPDTSSDDPFKLSVVVPTWVKVGGTILGSIAIMTAGAVFYAKTKTGQSLIRAVK